MEINPATNTGGGGGGPAPFLLKTYDMVDDTSTDEIVSWSSGRNSFVVWNPPEFARILLPTYFKHNNFSSFIRQLNTYGFRKIDPERWEFANEEFVKDQKHLLKNIHRRKPIHSHSNPQGSTVDPERAAFEEEIDKLSREKSALEANLLRYKKQQPIAKLQLEDLTHRIDSMEQKQESLLTFLEKAVHSPYFVENLAQKLESIDFTAYSKKRRLPQGEQSQTAAEDSFVDNQSTSRPEFVNIIQQDFSSRLRLELSPAVSDINLVSHSTQSSTEDLGSPQRGIPEACLNNAPTTRPGGLLFAAPETLELSDTGTSFTLNMDSSFSCKTAPSERVHCMQRKLNTNDEADGLISCHLNLTLASSSPLQVEKSQTSGRIGRPSEWLTNANPNEGDLRISEKNIPCSDGVVNDQGPPAAQAPRVNDVFWEQFLTERPGSSDVEEASSSYKVNAAYDEQEDRRSGGYGMSRNARSLEHLTL